MGHTTTTVSKPISFSDVNAVLGTTHTALSSLCQEEKIKKWAKWKPIPYATIGLLSDSARANSNYGIINIPTWSNINKMSNYWFGVDTTSANYPDCGHKPVFWGYRKPAGGASEPFRLADFINQAGTDGYYHGAEAPIGGCTASQYNIDSSGNLSIAFSYGAQSSGTIALSDLVYPRQLSYSISNMHLGMMLRNTSTGTRYAVTRTDTISSGITSISVSGLSSSYNGTYQVFPFLSSSVISFTSNLGQIVDGDFIALHDAEQIGIGTTIVKFQIDENTFHANRNTSQSTRLLYVGISVKNVNSGQMSARIDFYVYKSDNTQLATGTYTISGLAIGSWTSISTNIDMSSIANLRNAFTVQAIVTPTNVSNYGTSSAVATVTDSSGPSRE